MSFNYNNPDFQIILSPEDRLHNTRTITGFSKNISETDNHIQFLNVFHGGFGLIVSKGSSFGWKILGFLHSSGGGTMNEFGAMKDAQEVFIECASPLIILKVIGEAFAAGKYGTTA